MAQHKSRTGNRTSHRQRPKLRPGTTGPGARKARARRVKVADRAAAAGAARAVAGTTKAKATGAKSSDKSKRRAASPDLLERFRKANPMLWQQACRVFKVMELQKAQPGEAFPPGACFLYADLPAFDTFCVRRIHDLELDTCLVEIEVHADVGLEAGNVLLPLEHIRWFGLPSQAIPGGHPVLGFTTAADGADGPEADTPPAT